MSVRRCFRFSKVLAVLFTVYVSERYLDNRPVFRQTKTVRLFSFLHLRTFWRAGVYAAGGAMHRIVQNPCFGA